MDTLSSILQVCVLQDTEDEDSDSDSDARDTEEKEKEKDDPDLPVEASPVADHPEEKEGKRGDVDQPESPDRDPPLPQCYAIVNKIRSYLICMSFLFALYLYCLFQMSKACNVLQLCGLRKVGNCKNVP